MESIENYCPACNWTYRVPVYFSIESSPTNDYRRIGDEYLERHMRDTHGLMSVLKHEYELSDAINKATLEGERRGRLHIREEMKNATLEAMREIGRNL